MKKIVLGILIATIVLSISGVVAAQKLLPVAPQAKEAAKADNAPVIEKVTIKDEEYLALSTPGLEKIVYIHYKKGFAKPDWAGGNKGKKEPECYGFLGRGVKWNELPVNYVIDPDNPDGLTEAFVVSAMQNSAVEWDSHTSAGLFGNYSIDYESSWDIDAPDGRNELVFGDYPKDGVIAVTVVWGYFSGPPQTRKIVEFDVMFDTDFTWGYAGDTDETRLGDTGIMDLQNIATHELGHGVGLADVYETVCNEVTMHGYSENGETKKRTLEQPDINGLQRLYEE